MSKTTATYAPSFVAAYGKSETARATASVIAYRAATETGDKHADIAASFSRAIETSGGVAPKGTAYVGQMTNGVTAVMIVGALPGKLTADMVTAIQSAVSASSGRIPRDGIAAIADTFKGTGDYAGFAAALKSEWLAIAEQKRADKNAAKDETDNGKRLTDAIVADEENHGDVSALADFRALLARAGKLLDILAQNDEGDEYVEALALAHSFAVTYVGDVVMEEVDA